MMAAMISNANKDGYMMEDTAGSFPMEMSLWNAFDHFDGFGEGPGKQDHPMPELVLDGARPDERVKRQFKNTEEEEGGVMSSSLMTALQIMQKKEWQMPPSLEDGFRPVEMLLPRGLIDEIDDEKEEDNDCGEMGQEGDSESPLPSGPSRIFRLKTLLSTFIGRVYRAIIRMMEYIRTGR